MISCGKRSNFIRKYSKRAMGVIRCPILWADFLVQGTSKKFGFLVKGKVVHVEGNVLAAHTITEIALEVEITISNIVNANYNIIRAGTPPTKG